MKRATTSDSKNELDLSRVGAVIKLARENLRYSYRDLAERTGISHAQLMRMESGEFEFSVSKFYAVCASLGIPSGDLFEYASVRTFTPKDAIRIDPEIEQAIPSLDKSVKAKFEKLILDCFNIAVRTISSPDPWQTVLCVSRYLNAHMDEHFHGFAITVSHCSNVERIAMLDSLIKNPYGKLKSFDLIRPGYIITYLHSPYTWKPEFVAPTSIEAILQRR